MKFTFNVDSPTPEQLIAHARALLSIMSPDHLRDAAVHESITTLIHNFGSSLTIEEVAAIVAEHKAGEDKKNTQHGWKNARV